MTLYVMSDRARISSPFPVAEGPGASSPGRRRLSRVVGPEALPAGGAPAAIIAADIERPRSMVGRAACTSEAWSAQLAASAAEQRSVSLP